MIWNTINGKDRKKKKYKLFALVSSFLMTISSFTVVVSIVLLSLSFMATPVPAPDHWCEEGSPCCFMPGTPINLADGSYKNIEEIEIGDMVLVFNEKTMEVEIAPVTETDSVMRDDVFILFLENAKKLKPVGNHPFYTKDKGWATINGLDEVGLGCGKLEVGDSVYYLDDNSELDLVKVVGISRIPGRYLTYNLVDMKYGTFLADDVVTHNSGDDDPIEHDLECFVAGTKVLMADGSLKNIEDVQAGDFVKSINIQNMQLVDSEVTLLKEDYHSGLGDDFTVKIRFSDGTVSQCTNNHPYYVAGKGWASYRPDVGLYKYGFGSEILTIGDIVYKYGSEGLISVRVVSISEVYESIDTYDLVAVHPNNNFFADGILVHNSGGGDTTAPTIDSYSPLASSWSTSIPSVTVDVSDNVGLDDYWYEWSTSSSTPGTFDDGSGSVAGTSDDFITGSAPVASGQYYLHVKVRDTSANSKTGYSGTFKLDVVDPAAVSSWGGDAINTWTTDNNIDVSWSTPSDSGGSGLDGYDYSWSTSSASNPGSSKRIEQTVTSRSKSGATSGNWYFNIRTKDNAGNWDNSYVSRGPYKIDVTDPSASISINGGAAMTTSTSVTLSCSYSDSTSGVSEVRYLDSGGSWSSWQPAAGSKAWTLPATDGTRTVYYEVKDNAGNVKQVSDTISYNIPPVADFTLSSSTINCSETVAFTSTSSDEESISSYAWDLDNDGDTDFTGSSLDYTFNCSYAYTVKITVTDNEGTATSTTKTLNVNDQRSFHGGKNFITWRKNSIEASALADLLIALENGESIQVFNDGTNTCDWDSVYIQGVSTEEDDFTINRGDVLKITLNAGRTFSYSFGSANGDLNTQVTKTLKYIDGVDSNHGYNAIQWTKEQRVRCSEIADDISLANGQTIFVHDATDTYKTYLKLPGNPTAGYPTLDPWVYSGDVFWVKVPKGTDISYDSQLIGPTSTLGDDGTPLA